MIPSTKTVNVELQQMIAESVGLNGTYNGTDAIQSRRHNAWDDDDDEE